MLGFWINWIFQWTILGMLWRIIDAFKGLMQMFLSMCLNPHSILLVANWKNIVFHFWILFHCRYIKARTKFVCITPLDAPAPVVHAQNSCHISSVVVLQIKYMWQVIYGYKSWFLHPSHVCMRRFNTLSYTICWQTTIHIIIIIKSGQLSIFQI